MKKLIPVALCATALATAASWDGTQGSLTVKTETTTDGSLLRVTSADPTIKLISVTIRYWAAPSAVRQGTLTKTIPVHPGISPVAIFPVEESQITHVSVAGYREAERQAFTGQ